VAEVQQSLPPATPIEIWFQDEMRVGQKNKLTYRWARKGSRPRATHDQRTQSTYLFGAVCPELGTGAALVLPACNSEAMQLHLNEIATRVSPGAHAILILDQAAWHGSAATMSKRRAKSSNSGKSSRGKRCYVSRFSNSVMRDERFAGSAVGGASL